MDASRLVHRTAFDFDYPAPMHPLTVWTNLGVKAEFAADLERRLAPHRLVWAANRSASNLSSGSSDEVLVEQADIAIGQPSVEDLFAAKKLKLVCLSSAGYTRYDRDDLRNHCRTKGIAVCNASGVYAEPCAQHVLAMMMSVARQLPSALENQHSQRGWPWQPIRGGSVLLSDKSRVLIVGYGSIARRLVELLAPFRCSITAFRRKPTGDENCPTKPVSEVDAYLGDADHIVNILPAAASTANFFDAARFARIKPGVNFYNIGRGDTVDQSALAAALNSGKLAAAYLDVTNPEPLPPDHPLWTTPRCYITPHTGGGTLDESERQIVHFVDNVRRFGRGEAVVDRIF
jgi:phosphoglycerate dehydrogenase-like enzyme